VNHDRPTYHLHPLQLYNSPTVVPFREPITDRVVLVGEFPVGILSTRDKSIHPATVPISIPDLRFDSSHCPRTNSQASAIHAQRYCAALVRYSVSTCLRDGSHFPSFPRPPILRSRPVVMRTSVSRKYLKLTISPRFANDFRWTVHIVSSSRSTPPSRDTTSPTIPNRTRI
jgi:hypothetical protein